MEKIDQFNIPVNFNVSLYGAITKVTDTISKCRVRIFYKGLNRNRTYISDEFANQLISSLPYAPIKGIFDYAGVDYTDHGEDNTDGRIYGIIPENPNFSWEIHTDEDGVERTYASADVYLFTGLYPEAPLALDKPQSMEIYRNTLKGEWKIWEDGNPYFHFYSGSLVGLQILGKETEPCFEGAAFYTLNKDLQECINYIKQIKSIEEDGDKMEQINNSVIENTEPVIDDSAVKETVVEPVVDNVAVEPTAELIVEPEVKSTIEEPVIDNTIVSESAEEPAVETVVKNTEELNYEAKIDELKSTISVQAEKISAYETQISAQAEKISAYETQISELNAEKIRLETEKNDIMNENTILDDFKKTVENEKKTAILDEFATHLTDEQIEAFKANMSNYEITDFKKEVCTTAYEADPTMFSKKEDSSLIFKGGAPEGKTVESGVIRLLNKYKNGGNK